MPVKAANAGEFSVQRQSIGSSSFWQNRTDRKIIFHSLKKPYFLSRLYHNAALVAIKKNIFFQKYKRKKRKMQLFAIFFTDKK